MSIVFEEGAKAPLVLTIHGIRTTGKWQDDLSEALEEHGFRHRPLNFGFFNALALLLPWSRKKKIEWFRREYDSKVGDSSARPSIIAHSFGTYIVAGALEKYDLMIFNRIIFCGSIVRRDFPWSDIIGGGQASKVLNEVGGKDFWSDVVEWVVSDAGSSGARGFKDLAEGNVMEIRHGSHEHSDYFFRRNYIQRWIPFIEGKELGPVRQRAPRGRNWKFICGAITFIVLFVLASLYVKDIIARTLGSVEPSDSPPQDSPAGSAVQDAPVASDMEPASIANAVFEIQNDDEFCGRLLRVVGDAKNSFSVVKGASSGSGIMEGWKVNIRLPNSDWCSLSTMPGIQSSHIYYSCKVGGGTIDIETATARHIAYLGLVKECLGKDWLAQDAINEDDARYPGDTAFDSEKSPVRVEFEFDLDEDGKSADSMLYVHER